MSEDSESSAVAPVSYQHKYKTLKRKLKFLVYEQELFKEELDKCHKKLLRITQDKSFLLDRLMRYESVYMSEDDTLSWLSDEESSSESATSAPPPSKVSRKIQPVPPTTSISAGLKVPSKREGNGPASFRENKSPIASKQLPQKPNRTIGTKPVVTTLEITNTIPDSLVVRIPLPLAKQQQQQQQPAAATPTPAVVAKKTLGSGSSSLSSSDISDSDSDTNRPVTAASTSDSVRKTILRVPHNIKTTIITKQPSAITTTTETTVTKATTISQVMSKPTLTIPSHQVLLKPLTGKNASSNISQRLANIYSPTQVKAFQLSKTVTSPKSTTGGTLPFAAFTWSNRTTTSNTSVETTSNNTGFTLLSPSNASKLQLPFTSLTSNQTGAFRVIAQTTSVNTSNSDTAQQQSTTQQ